LSKNEKAVTYSSMLLKKSVAAVYETNTFNSFLKDILHPGGLELTRRVAEVAHIDENCKVLDIACGKGKGPLLLAEKFNCIVVGIDMSEKKITLAQKIAKSRGLNNQVKFIISDAEDLPFMDATFGVVLSECSFSVLPNKNKAASEIKRVLKPGGRLVVTDIFLKKRTIGEFQNELAFGSDLLLPCIAGAKPIEDYVGIFKEAGLCHPFIEDHSIELKKLIFQMAITFGDWEEFLCRLSSELSQGSSTKERKDFASSVKAYRKMFAQGEIGYTLIRFTKLK